MLVRHLPEPYQDINFFQRLPGWGMSTHQHDFYQLIYVTGGTLDLSDCSHRHLLSRGHVCIIPPFHNHALHTDVGYEQFGINLEETSDGRGLIGLLAASFSEVAIFEKLELLEMLPAIKKECGQISRLSTMKVACQLDRFLLACIDAVSSEGESEFRRKLVGYLSDRLPRRVTLSDVYRQMAMSQTQLERLCHQEFGCGVIEVYNQLKINKAYSLLINSEMSIDGIAQHLGYYDQAHFSHFFKQKTRFTPSLYRKMNR